MEELFNRFQCTNEQDWLEHRKDGIGGSSCSCIIGLNPFKSNVDYWKEKTGIKPSEDLSNKPSVRYGKIAEDYIRNMFILDYESVLEVYHSDFELLIRKDKPFIRSSLDGELRAIDDCMICGKEIKAGMRGILEIKTCEPMRSATLESWKYDNVPTNYHCQRLHYLLTTGYDFHILRCDFRLYDNERQSWKHWTKDYCILKNEDGVQEQLDYLEEQETKFWNENIVGKKEPNLKIDI